MSAGGGTLSALDRDLCALLVDMRSDKITARQKAFEKLDAILSTREAEIMRYMEADKFDTGWGDLLEAAHHGIQRQNQKMLDSDGATATKGKSSVYIVVIQKIVELAMNRNVQRLKFSSIICRSLEELENRSMRQHFGACYVQLLQKYVLASKWDLTTIVVDEWKDMLRCCFMLLKENKIERKVVVGCLSLAVRKFLENCSVQTYLVGYLEQLADMISATEKERCQQELVRVAFHITSAIAVDCRMAVCAFLEKIGPNLIKAYEPKMETDAKSTLFKLMHLSLIVHHPEKDTLDWKANQELFYSCDRTMWFKCLRQYHYIMGNEIKSQLSAFNSGASSRDVKFVDGFVDFAARLCYVIFWNDDIWSDTEDENNSNAKRIKRTNKIQSLVDLVETGSNQYNWRWLIILATVLECNAGVVSDEDYQPLLQLLVNIQPTLQTGEQLNALAIGCKVLLEFEQSSAFHHSLVIDRNFSEELWHKMTTTCFRSSTTSNKTAAENNLLLQLLVRHGKYPNSAFLCSVLEAFYTYSIERTNVNVSTILVILQSVSLECLGIVDVTTEKLFAYLYPKSHETQGKRILHSKEQIDMKLLAEISIHSVVTKHRKESTDASDDATVSGKYLERSASIRSLEEHLLMKNLDRLLIAKIRPAPCQRAAHELTSFNINERSFERLCEAINFNRNTLPEENEALAKAAIKRCNDVELYLQMLNVLALHNAMSQEQFAKCALTKKVAFKFQELNIAFSRLDSVGLNSVDRLEIGTRLLAIFQGPYHQLINELLKPINCENVLVWIEKQIVNACGEDSARIELLQTGNLSKEQKIKHCFVSILAHYMQYDGVCNGMVMDVLENLNLNINNSVDLFYVFELSKIIVRQRSTYAMADLVLNYVKEACKVHHPNTAVTEAIVDIYAALVLFVSPHESLTRNVTIVLHSFIGKCGRKIYSAELQAKIVSQIKYLLKAFPRYFESHEKVYTELVALLHVNSFAIQLTVVENLIHLLAADWAYGECEVPLKFYEFQAKMYEMLQFDVEEAMEMDGLQRTVAIYLQLILGIFTVSFILRKRTIRDFVRLIYEQSITEDKIKAIVHLVNHSSGIDFRKALREAISSVLDMWLTQQFRLAQFPWHITECESLESFVCRYKKEIAFAILCSQPGDFEKFCQSMKMSVNSIFDSIAARCLAFLLPKYTNCQNMHSAYKDKADAMHSELLPRLQAIKLESHSQEIIKHLTQQLYDAPRMAELFEREVFPGDDASQLGLDGYLKALEHLKKSFDETMAHSITTHFCVEQPSTIERSLMHLKYKLCSTKQTEQQMVYLYQYSVLVDLLAEYLNEVNEEQKDAFKHFLVRDICYFLCNLLDESKALHIPTLNCFGAFLRRVLPVGVRYLKLHLNFIVSSLLAVRTAGANPKVAEKSLALLRFVVIEQKEILSDAIGQLNYFPMNEEYTEMRTMLQECKCSDAKPSLRDEMGHVLQRTDLKHEDLIALRTMLTNRKDELKDICNGLDNPTGLSDECNESILHHLINVLLNVVKSSKIDNRSTEALRCLGEIGPVDLGTMLLRSDVETHAYETIDNFEQAVEQCLQAVVDELERLLTHKKIAVVRTVTNVCYRLLQCKKFHKFAGHHKTLYPFMGNSTKELTVFSRGSAALELSNSLLADREQNYHRFVLQLATALLVFLNDKCLEALVEIEHSFAEKLVPLLLQIVLRLDDTAVNNDVEAFVNGFFGKFSTVENSDEGIFNNPEAIHLMLKLVECIRMNNQSFPQCKIVLNYLPIASASQHCQAYFKSILYSELWCQEEIEKDPSLGMSQLRANHTLMDLMKAAHLAVGVDDAVKAFLDPIRQRSEYYRLERKFAPSLLYYDVACSSGGSAERMAFGEALKGSSLYGLASSMVAKGNNDDYDCAWRLADWSVTLDDGVKASGGIGESKVNFQQSFEKAHYKALKCLELKDELATVSAIGDGRRAIAEMLKRTSTESTKNIYRYMCKLRLLEQIEEFCEIQFYKQIDCEQEMLGKWSKQDDFRYSEFSSLETILTQRLTILGTARLRAKRKWVPDAVSKTLLNLIHEARVGGFYDCAMRNIALINQLDLQPNVLAVIMLEDAQLNWAHGDQKLARDLAYEVMDNKRYNDLMVKGAACRIFGDFLAESHTKDVNALYKEYFRYSQTLVEKALSQMTQQEEPVAGVIDHGHKCFQNDRNFIVVHTVARYADREFMRLNNFVHSKEWEIRRANMEKMQRQVQKLEQEATGASGQKAKEIGRLRLITLKNLSRDKRASDIVESERLMYLQLSLCFYISYAKQSTIDSDLAVFRIVALWFGNHHEQVVHELISEELRQIPTHKFIPVLPQLTPRLSNHSNIGKVVAQTLERCAIMHPYHTLPHLFAQVYAYGDQQKKDVPKDDERLLGAEALHKMLAKQAKISPIVEQMNKLSAALIEFANKPLSKDSHFQEYSLTDRDALRRFRNLDMVQCPTLELPVVESGVYKDRIVGIRKWESKIVGVGGINAPKKLKCVCLDGKVRTQLLKGNDDMRQDAVMQQVFSILNILLRSDKEASKRKLSVRTYKVVPLSKQSGILEWCENTVPIGVWLSKGHVAYRPSDYAPNVARKKYNESTQPKMTLDLKLKNYLAICDKIQPVFRHYFLEHYLKPGQWFERRQCYVKSVAASSMVGHILGIGDRHVQNILIDQRTAEVIHIDFGIAFEMGKNLPTPETVPFRLTRDIVDGMGFSGVEGVFKKSCEKTMDVLRNNQAPILTILEVLLYDPLYSWNVLSNKKATRRQLEESQQEENGNGVIQGQNINVTAERALMLVGKKLEGKEDDKFISVEGQVHKLIFSATNERNLCQLFAGWQPYL